MELYALSLNGSMLYFYGKIPEIAYEKIDSLIQEIDNFHFVCMINLNWKCQ